MLRQAEEGLRQMARENCSGVIAYRCSGGKPVHPGSPFCPYARCYSGWTQ